MKLSKMAEITVNLDWLSILFIHAETAIPEPPTPDGDFVFETKNLSFVYTGVGQKHYKYIWNVYFSGEHLATLLSHTRNDKFVRKNHCKVDFKNHLLYSAELWPFYYLLVKELNLIYKNVSRLDIAIDGVNYLLKLLNAYTRQEPQNKVMEFKGKPSINPGILDKPTMLYQYFRFSKPGAKKVLVIYNKSLDIVKTRKKYIQDFWLQNGILKDVIPIEELAKHFNKKEEKTYLEGYQNIYRIEFRLSGEKIKEIDGFTIELLQTPDGLISIFKLMARQYFDAFWLENNNTALCSQLPLIPFANFEIIPLEKIVLKRQGDLYKTKLSINKNIHQLFTGELNPENGALYDMLNFDIKQYELQKWFLNKLPEWVNQYEKQQKDIAYRELVNEYLTDLAEDISRSIGNEPTISRTEKSKEYQETETEAPF